MRKQSLHKFRHFPLKYLMLSGLSVIAFQSMNVQAMGPACQVYAIHDGGLNNSQMLTFDIYKGLTIEGLGAEYKGYDLEAMDMDFSSVDLPYQPPGNPDGVKLTGKLYVAAGDDVTNGQPGYLYQVNEWNGDLIESYPTGYAEIDGITFRPTDNTLWGWAQDAGLFMIPRVGEDPYADLDLDNTKLIIEKKGEFEDITWDLSGTVLCVAENVHEAYNHPYIYTDDLATHSEPNADASVSHKLWCYDVPTGDVINITEKCNDTLGKIEVEALDVMPYHIGDDDSLVIGYHNSNNLPVFAMVNTNTCKVSEKIVYNMPYNHVLEGRPDIEGLAWLCPWCVDEWSYVTDYSADNVGGEDGTWVEDPNEEMKKASPILVGGNSPFEIYGMAMKQTHNEDGVAFITVAFNANLPLEGFDSNNLLVEPNVAGSTKKGIRNIGWGDFIMRFTNTEAVYGVHFAAANDSPRKLGLYKDVITTYVGDNNFAWHSFNSYNNFVESKGEIPSLGDVEKNYFGSNEKAPTSIEKGEKVADIEILTLSDLKTMKDFDVNDMGGQGEYTFGFRFKKTSDMKGEFLAHIFIECANDGIVIKGDICP
ncbi:MAG: hypothetical protein DRQ49_15680 [Gammaproteobacteria bacterium]|nr:MAG: hypothetical protein DRQ49_15680 [Gammaproteobacteria bacterium]RKZ38308.1 MAG: hypothetical protein DRQ41_12255 [Gammaproteobacteria bacterium]